MAHCDEDSRDPNDDHWIFEELGSPIKSRKRRPHRNVGAVKTYRTISTSTEDATINQDTFEEKLKIYADNMRKLIITARKEINALKEENIALKHKLESSGTIECPACLFLFRPQEEHKVFPKYIKVFRGRLCLEIEFNNLEQMNHWLNANHLDVNSDGLPTVITEVKKDDLLSTGSLLPQLIEKRAEHETNKERIVISTRAQRISENSLIGDQTRKVLNHCKDHETPSTSSQHRASVEVHEVHRTYEEGHPDLNEERNSREAYTFDRRIENDLIESSAGRKGSDRSSVSEGSNDRTKQGEENLVRKSCDSGHSEARQRFRDCARISNSSATELREGSRDGGHSEARQRFRDCARISNSSATELREGSRDDGTKEIFSNKENLVKDVGRARNVISDKSKSQMKRSRAVRKSLSSKKSKHDQRSTKCNSVHSGPRSRNGHRIVRDSSGHLRSEQSSSFTSHSRRLTHDVKERLPANSKISRNEKAHSHESKSALTLRESSHKHNSSCAAKNDRESGRNTNIRLKERAMESSTRETAMTERNDRSDRVNRRSRSKEVSRKRSGRDCATSLPDSKRRRSSPREKDDALVPSSAFLKDGFLVPAGSAKEDDIDKNNDDDIDSLSDADLVIIDEEEVEDGEILE